MLHVIVEPSPRAPNSSRSCRNPISRLSPARYFHSESRRPNPNRQTSQSYMTVNEEQQLSIAPRQTRLLVHDPSALYNITTIRLARQKRLVLSTRRPSSAPLEAPVLDLMVVSPPVKEEKVRSPLDPYRSDLRPAQLVVSEAPDETGGQDVARAKVAEDEGSGDADGSEDGKHPAVEPETTQPEPDVYDRFSNRKKGVILAIVSFSAFLSRESRTTSPGPKLTRPAVCSSIFLPSIPVMSTDLHTTPSVIDYTVSIFLVTIGVAPLLWSPLSGFYGRRPIYLVSLPIMIVASVGVALSRNVGDIIGTRVLQGIGGCAVLSVGAGSVGDLYRPTQRANAMGWFYSGALMGPSFAPVIGGLFTQYTRLSWRSAQYFVAGVTGLAFSFTFFFLPETSHPPLPHATLKAARGKKFVWFRFNPFAILGLFRWPNICAIVSSICPLHASTADLSRPLFRVVHYWRPTFSWSLLPQSSYVKLQVAIQYLTGYRKRSTASPILPSLAACISPMGKLVF